MAVGSSAGVDGAVELQVFADAAGAEVHGLGDGAGKLRFIDCASAVGVDVERKRFGNANRVGHLDRAFFGIPSRNDIFGEVAGGVGSGAVNLRRIFA